MNIFYVKRTSWITNESHRHAKIPSDTDCKFFVSFVWISLVSLYSRKIAENTTWNEFIWGIRVVLGNVVLDSQERFA